MNIWADFRLHCMSQELGTRMISRHQTSELRNWKTIILSLYAVFQTFFWATVLGEVQRLKKSRGVITNVA